MSEHGLHTIDPVTLGVRLAEARRARRLTQQEVADTLEVARTTIVAMEKGERRPRAAELVKLAALFGRAVREFLEPEPKDHFPSFLVQFRQSRRAGTSQDVDRVEDIRQFERLCRWYAELEALDGASSDRHYPAQYEIVGAPPERAALDVATAERNRLGLGDGPIGDLWDLLDRDVGLRVFAFPFRDRQSAGMYLYTEELGGCIAVNANHPEERQRWSAVHEYGHFLTRRHQPDVAVLAASKQVKASERFADAFARNFLMPVTGLTRRFDAMRRAKDGPFTPGGLLQLASHFSVSVQAMTWRLEDLRLLPAGTWDRLKDLGFRPSEARRLVGLSVERTGTRRLPQRYVTLAVQAYQAGELTEGQLADRLLTDRVGAREIVSQISTVEQPSDSGSWTQVTLDLGQSLATSS